MNDLNPAVERAVLAAGRTPKVGDWLRILLADDEGRPAMLVEKLGLSLSAIQAQIQAANTMPLDAESMLRRAREHSIRLKADPDVTTDLLLVTAFFEDPSLAEALGVRLDMLDNSVRSPMIEAAAPQAEREVTFQPPDVTDRHDAARIVDANLNRARESLRVLDDYARFTKQDAGLTESVKALRHQLADLEAHLPLSALLRARDVPRDVGTAISAAGEYDRGSPKHVAAVNAKRLQECLRSLEEYGKILSPHFSREIEAIRYRAYDIERALLGGSPLRERLQEAKLYLLLSGEGSVASLEWTLTEAAAGGVGIVQLREKTLTDRELLQRAIEMREWTKAAKVLFIVNDRPDIARLCQADGVHLGQDDMSVSDARRILGPQPLIGVSTHNEKQIHQAVRDGADYLGVGPCFPSRTKSFDRLAGTNFIDQAARLTSLPWYALGGIDEVTIDQAVAAGAKRVAVSAAVALSDDPRLTAARLINSLS